MSPELSPSESVRDTPLHGEDGDDSLQPELKLKKKDLKRMFDPTRELDGWERYRALIDASDEAYDLIDISNREARFALIVMGALNALPLLLLTKTDIIADDDALRALLDGVVPHRLRAPAAVFHSAGHRSAASRPVPPVARRTGRRAARICLSACGTTRT